MFKYKLAEKIIPSSSTLDRTRADCINSPGNSGTLVGRVLSSLKWTCTWRICDARTKRMQYCRRNSSVMKRLNDIHTESISSNKVEISRSVSSKCACALSQTSGGHCLISQINANALIGHVRNNVKRLPSAVISLISAGYSHGDIKQT